MLVSFRFGNYKSFRDEYVFTMEKDKVSDLSELNTFKQNNYELLKSAIIYGRNASGKSNLFKALSKMREIVLRSTEEEPKYKIDVDCFLLNQSSCNKPTLFETEFIVKDVLYKYGFEILNYEVHTEWLYKKEQRYVNLFNRTSPDKESIKIVQKYNAEWNKYAEMTRRNSLFLSRMANLACDFAIELRNWFMNLKIVTSDYMRDSITNNYVSNSEDFRKSVVSFLQKAHVDIEDIKAEMVPIEMNMGKMPESLKKELLKILIKEDTILEINKTESLVPEIKTIHSIFDNENKRVSYAEFNISQESKGTQKLYALSASIIEVLKEGGILFIDEFDTNLHPELTEYIISLFNSINNNKKNAQLIVITHNPLLMDSKYIRRDQIWIVDKDKYGSSDLYRVTDFNVRKDKKLMKSYLLGQFGSVPDIDNDEVLQ